MHVIPNQTRAIGHFDLNVVTLRRRGTIDQGHRLEVSVIEPCLDGIALCSCARPFSDRAATRLSKEMQGEREVMRQQGLLDRLGKRPKFVPTERDPANAGRLKATPKFAADLVIEKYISGY